MKCIVTMKVKETKQIFKDSSFLDEKKTSAVNNSFYFIFDQGESLCIGLYSPRGVYEVQITFQYHLNKTCAAHRFQCKIKVQLIVDD